MKIEALLCQVLITLAATCAFIAVATSQGTENHDRLNGNMKECEKNCTKPRTCVDGNCIDPCLYHQCGEDGKCVLWRNKKPTCRCYNHKQIELIKAKFNQPAAPKGEPCPGETNICHNGRCFDGCHKNNCSVIQKCIPDKVLGYPENLCIEKDSHPIAGKHGEQQTAKPSTTVPTKKQKTSKGKDDKQQTAKARTKAPTKEQTQPKGGDSDENTAKPKLTAKKKKETQPASRAKLDSGLNFPIMFMVCIVLVVAGYFIYHYRKKLLGLILEGRASGKGGKYSKVSVEDVMPRLRNAKLSV